MNKVRPGRNQKNLTVVNRMRALPGERTKILCKKAKDFRVSSTDEHGSVFIGGLPLKLAL